MAKAANELATKPTNDLALARPSFMTVPEGMSTGLDEVQKFMQVPRIKHVQNNAKSPYKELFKGGELAAVPLMQSITNGPADPKKPAYHFVPLHFFVEYITWNPYGAGGNAIRARSFEPDSEIAIKSRDGDKRKEPCHDFPQKDGKPQLIKHLTHMVWVVLILEPNPLAGIPIAMNFSSGEYKAGSAFSTLIGQRNPLGTPRDQRIPLFGMQFAAYVRERKNQQGEWYGTDVQNPALDSGVTPLVQDADKYAMYAETAKLLQQKHAEQLLVVEMDDEAEGAEAASPADSKKY
jgi:hypothetical protein